MGEDVTGAFYESELQLVDKNIVDTARVGEILKRRTVKGVKEVLVSWEGYPEKFNSWIPERNLVK